VKSDKLKIRLPSLHPTQKIVAQNNHRFRVLATGRRFGKSRLAVLLCLYEALNGGNAFYVGPYNKTTDTQWRLLRRLTRQIPNTKISETKKRVAFPFVSDDAAIEFRSAENDSALRGEGLSFLVVDEMAYIKKGVWEEVLRPTLSDKKGKAIFISSPKGRGEFFHLYTRGQDPTEHPDWISWQFPSSCNPFLDPLEIEAAKNELPEAVFNQEYLAEFLDDSAGVFKGVKDCVGLIQNNELSGKYCIGVDLAKYHDYSVILVMDRAKGIVIETQRFNKIDWLYQRGKIVEAAKKYHAQVHIDATGVGDPVYEELSRSGINIKPHKFTNESKAHLIQQLQLAIENKKIKIPPKETQLISELQSYEYTMTPTGKISYNAPSGYYDDCVIALALAFDICSLSYSGGSSVHFVR
jgi:hypothetical protein